MIELTKAEEQVMKHLWRLERAFLKDIAESYPDPKPAYTTVSTVVNVLVRKKFIGYKTYGKTREYFPLVSRKNYSRFSMQGLMRKFFNDSPQQFASFFARESDLSVSELREIEQLIQQEITRKKHE